MDMNPLQDILGKDTAIGQTRHYLQSVIMMQKAWYASDNYTRYLSEPEGSGKKQVLKRNCEQQFNQIIKWLSRTILKNNKQYTYEDLEKLSLGEKELLIIKHLDEDLAITKLDVNKKYDKYDWEASRKAKGY